MDGPSMELNVHKAGMVGLNKDLINEIIQKASEGSKYLEHQKKKEMALEERIRRQTIRLDALTEEQTENSEKEMDAFAEELEKSRHLDRWILHIDMDAFYAAVEMRDDPSLRDKPMAVGSDSMLSTSNYLARGFGVRAAMPGFIARKLCPSLTIVPCRFDAYRKISSKIRRLLADYDPGLAMASLDEAYLDITDFLTQRNEQEKCHVRRRFGGPCFCWLPRVEAEAGGLEESCLRCGRVRVVLEDEVGFGGDVEAVVKEIRFKIEQTTGLTASAGIAANTMLAKICSDRNKPNGQFLLPRCPIKIVELIQDLPLRKVNGIGSASEAMLGALGISTCGDVFERRGFVALLFSPVATRFLLKMSLGIASTFFSKDGGRKSVSVERTFGSLTESNAQIEMCRSLCLDLAQDLDGLKGRTVTLKLKLSDFSLKTRSMTLPNPVDTEEELYRSAQELLLMEQRAHCDALPLRLMGVRLSNLVHPDSATVALKRFLAVEESSCSEAELDAQTTPRPTQEIRLTHPVSSAPPAKKTRASDVDNNSRLQMKTLETYFTKCRN